MAQPDRDQPMASGLRRLGAPGGVLPGVVSASVTAALCLLSWVVPTPGPDATGPQALLRPAYAILLSLLVIGIGTALGRQVLHRILPWDELDPLEALVFSFALGMGLIGLGVYTLGVAGLFRPAWIAVFLVGAAAISPPRGIKACPAAQGG